VLSGRRGIEGGWVAEMPAGMPDQKKVSGGGRGGAECGNFFWRKDAGEKWRGKVIIGNG